MEIRDYELRQNIDMFFQMPIYIYGAGEVGQKIEYLVTYAGMDMKCFIDKRAGEIKRNHEVINVDVFAENYNRFNKECIIVLAQALIDDCNILREELNRKEISAKFVFTGWAVEAAILSSLDDARIPRELGKNYLKIKQDKKKALLGQLLTQNLWVWQPGKVGSSTVLRTLKQHSVECVHIHNIVRLMESERLDDYQLRKRVGTEQIKIITLVREPIARDIADYFENYYLHCMNKETVQDVLVEAAEKNHQFMWYDWEIKALLGIDVFEYPFDRENGYGLIKKDNIEILILKLESLNKNAEILGKFVGLDNLVLENANEGAKKPYAKLYQEVRDTLIIPQKVIDRYYKGNDRMNHFYTDKEKNAFLEKWCLNRNKCK